ncbi:MAG: hypothetical protein E7071_04710 [Bacteroidales bacterium]|nr:hypothetical protein [Bacteroidales bacterium]
MRVIILLILFSIFSFSTLCAQSVESLKSQRTKSENEIKKLNTLIEEAKKNKNSTIQQINLYERKISETNNVINTLNKEVDNLNRDIDKNFNSINNYEIQREKLLEFYGKAIYEQWKVRNFENQFLYILASNSFDQAYRRFRYYKEMKYFTKNKIKEIQIINDSLKSLNERNRVLLDRKVSAKVEVSNMQRSLNEDKNREQTLLNNIKKNETSLRNKLNKEIANKKALDSKIKKLIEQQVKKSTQSSSTGQKVSQVDIQLANDFEGNKGKLPWPVDGGVIIEKFGTHTHPVLKNVQTNSSGIVISCKKDSQVKSIFKGTVVSIHFVSSSNNVVLIKHGNYFTLYVNLSEVYVKQGDSITTGQKLGKVAYSSEKGSTMELQIWKELTKLNPEFWLRN